MTARGELGAGGEALAEEFLRRGGYAILERNFRSRRGEIDIVALDGGTVVFVEVKTRRSCACGGAAEAVDARKQRRVVEAARYYLHRNGATDRDCRFDVIAVELGRSDGQDITHIRNAFNAE